MKPTLSLPWIVGGIVVVWLFAVLFVRFSPSQTPWWPTPIQVWWPDLARTDSSVQQAREVVLPEFPLASVTPSSGARFELTEWAETLTLRQWSTIEWTWPRVRESYRGSLLLRQWAVQVIDGELVGWAIVFDMNLLRPVDEWSIWLDSLLKSEEYFDVRNFPTASFVLESITSSQITGVLTMRWVTRQIVFPATVMVDDSGILIVSDFAFNIGQRGIMPTDNTLSEFVDVSFTLSFIQ